MNQSHKIGWLIPGKRLLKRYFHLPAIVLIALTGSWSDGYAQEFSTNQRSLQSLKRTTTTDPLATTSPKPAPTAQIKNAYILGPGDTVIVELLDVPEYSGVFPIGPDGTIYLPRLRSLYVEGFTVEELRNFLTKQFSTYVHDPQVFISPIVFRPIRVYIGGEIQRPGYYYLTNQQQSRTRSDLAKYVELNEISPDKPNVVRDRQTILDYSAGNNPTINGEEAAVGLRLPNVFDALRAAGGVTPFSKLSDVLVTRRRPLSSGGGKIQAKLNFLELITKGDETQNIRLFDGDTIIVGRSPVELRDQIIKAGQTNLSPDYVLVYVSGRVRDPGSRTLPQGATLEQALASAGGQKLIRGQVEFIRFNRNGTTDRRKFFVNGANPAGSYKNPVLMQGDVVRVNDSPISATLTVLNEFTSPALGIYSIYNLFQN